MSRRNNHGVSREGLAGYEVGCVGCKLSFYLTEHTPDAPEDAVTWCPYCGTRQQLADSEIQAVAVDIEEVSRL